MSDTHWDHLGWRIAQFLRQRPFLGAAALIAMVLAVYRPALDGAFVWDDAAYVTGDARLESAAGLERIWTEVGGPHYTHQYYPMTSSVFWVQYQLWGERSSGYHVVNVLLHAANVLLLWRLLVTLRVPGAWAGAAIFALHPVHVPSVAWIAELKNVLSCCFFLLSMHAFVRSFKLDAPHDNEPAETPPPRRRGLYLAGVASFLVALLSKTATGLLPAALLLLIAWKRGRGTRALWRRDLIAIAPLFALALAFMALTSGLEAHHRANGAAFELSWLDRAMIAGCGVWFSAAKLLWPAGLSVVYARWTPSAWMAIFLVAGAAATWGLWATRRRIGRGPLVAWLYFAVAVAPVSLVNVGFHQYAYVADHWQYWSSMALIAAVVGLVGGWVRRAESIVWRRLMPAAALTVVLATLGGMTWSRAHIFQGPVELWTDAARRNPQSMLACYNLGVALQQQGRSAEAADAFREAVRLDPGHARSHHNLGVALWDLERADEAIEQYETALSLDPDLAMAHLNLAAALHAQGRYARAVEHYDRALALRPDLASVRRRRNLAAQALDEVTVNGGSSKDDTGFGR